ncbi:MAG: hypothetical protein AB7P23_01480 [Amphiplicatus sp.]
MLARLGVVALVVLLGSETFVMSGAVLWPIAALLHLGTSAQIGALALAALMGAGAGGWIGWRAMKVKGETSGF